jgi:hypothetical protein
MDSFAYGKCFLKSKDYRITFAITQSTYLPTLVKVKNIIPDTYTIKAIF